MYLKSQPGRDNRPWSSNWSFLWFLFCNRECQAFHIRIFSSNQFTYLAQWAWLYIWQYDNVQLYKVFWLTNHISPPSVALLLEWSPLPRPSTDLSPLPVRKYAFHEEEKNLFLSPHCAFHCRGLLCGGGNHSSGENNEEYVQLEFLSCQLAKCRLKGRSKVSKADKKAETWIGHRPCSRWSISRCLGSLLTSGFVPPAPSHCWWVVAISLYWCGSLFLFTRNYNNILPQTSAQTGFALDYNQVP